MSRRVKWAVYGGVLLIVAVATAGVMYLVTNISERKGEGREYTFRTVELNDSITDAAVWGKDFPKQYQAYRATAEDSKRTEFGGGEPFDKLAADPTLKTIFAGYAFAIEYNEERGHEHMLADQERSRRVLEKPQPGACLNCHASVNLAYYTAGVKAGAAPAAKPLSFLDKAAQTAMDKGFATICALPYADARKLVEHPITCVDCHDSQTMQLRVARPAFLTGIDRLAHSDAEVPALPSIEAWRAAGKKGTYDPNTLASRQEMRTMVCGQCHVEYYFKGDAKLLTFPWHDGLQAEQMESYYDEVGWADWEHAQSGAAVLKAQHPEFETWNQGIHARSGVACADCHMPYVRSGAVKISEHRIRSPLNDVNAACGNCHSYDDEELLARVGVIQRRTFGLLQRAQERLTQLIAAIAAAKTAGADDAQLAAARTAQRRAQWRIDLVNAENSMGFHAPEETAKNLALALDFIGEGLTGLAELGTGAK